MRGHAGAALMTEQVPLIAAGIAALPKNFGPVPESAVIPRTQASCARRHWTISQSLLRLQQNGGSCVARASSESAHKLSSSLSAATRSPNPIFEASIRLRTTAIEKLIHGAEPLGEQRPPSGREGRSLNANR